MTNYFMASGSLDALKVDDKERRWMLPYSSEKSSEPGGDFKKWITDQQVKLNKPQA